jgi:hypothetical protein
MTAKELRAILVSAEYKQDLEEMSAYLASIKQERPIIYCLAKFLWKRGQAFRLEDKRRDLVIADTHLEFKYNFDCDMAKLEDELKTYADMPLKAMWEDTVAKKISKSWCVMPKIYEDACIKKVRNRLADIFVWIICSRDLKMVSPDALQRICWSTEQRKWSTMHPYSDRTYLNVADLLLERLQAVRRFAVLTAEIATSGDFPSTYHFRICDFSANGA